jgi:LPXTG-motif cell wall-anchored protein
MMHLFCSNFGNTDLNCQYGVTNTQGTIIVQKTYTGSSAKTFTFGLFSGSTCLQTRVLSFSASGTQTATFSVTGSVDGTAVQELDNSKNIIPLNGSYDNVTLTKRENGSKTTTQSCSNTSYIGSFCNMANVQLYDHNKLYIKSNNSNCFVNASGKKIIYHGRDGIYASAANSIGVATTFPDLSGMLDSMETLSAQLAQAKTTDTVLVENYTAWDIEHLGNNQLNFTLNDGQILLLNIDATWDSNLTFSSSSPLRINGTSSGGWSSYAGSVIINVYTKFFNQFCPYSGKIFNVQYIMGILLAPDATVTVQSSYNGNIVANSVYCCYGEIHGCIWNTVTESITWTLVNQEIAVVYTLPATGGIGTGLFYSAGLGLIFLATCLTILLGKRRERSDSS